MPAQGEPRAVPFPVHVAALLPIGPDALRGDWELCALEPGRCELEGFSVVAREIRHRGGRTFGFRISDARAALAYLPDHGPAGAGDGPDGLGAYHPAALELARDVDLLIHDAQHTAAEFAALRHRGHAGDEMTLPR